MAPKPVNSDGLRANLGAERHANVVLQRPEASCSQLVYHVFATDPGWHRENGLSSYTDPISLTLPRLVVP